MKVNKKWSCAHKNLNKARSFLVAGGEGRAADYYMKAYKELSNTKKLTDLKDNLFFLVAQIIYLDSEIARYGKQTKK